MDLRWILEEFQPSLKPYASKDTYDLINQSLTVLLIFKFSSIYAKHNWILPSLKEIIANAYKVLLLKLLISSVIQQASVWELSCFRIVSIRFNKYLACSNFNGFSISSANVTFCYMNSHWSVLLTSNILLICVISKHIHKSSSQRQISAQLSHWMFSRIFESFFLHDPKV